jgi:hypothetical protein
MGYRGTDLYERGAAGVAIAYKMLLTIGRDGQFNKLA